MPWDINGTTLQVTASIASGFSRTTARMPRRCCATSTSPRITQDRGPNSIMFSRTKMNERAVARVHLESRLRQALERGEFELHYQPQVNLKTFRVIGAEALNTLARCTGQSDGADAVYSARRRVRADCADRRMGVACRLCQAVAWQKLGLPPLCIAVNVSGRQLRQNDFVAVVRSALRDTGSNRAGWRSNYRKLLMEQLKRVSQTSRNCERSRPGCH